MTIKWTELNTEFFKTLDPSLSDRSAESLVKLNKIALKEEEKIPMPWDDNLNRNDKITMNKQDLTMAIDNLKELNWPMLSIVSYIFEEVIEIYMEEKTREEVSKLRIQAQALKDQVRKAQHRSSLSRQKAEKFKDDYAKLRLEHEALQETCTRMHSKLDDLSAELQKKGSDNE